MKKSTSLTAGLIIGIAVVIAAYLMQDGWDKSESWLLLTTIASTIILFFPEKCKELRAKN